MSSCLLSFFLLLPGCLQRPGVDIGTASTGGTTATTATTATTGTTGTTSTGTTPTVSTGPEALGWLVVPEGAPVPDSVTVALMSYHLEEGGGGEQLPVVDELLAASRADGDLRFAVPLPDDVPEEDYVELDPKAYPGFELAAYLVLAHPDEDADGAWAEGDPLWGTSLAWAWGRTRGGEAWGVEDGWHVLAVEGEKLTFLEPTVEVELVLRGLQAELVAAGKALDSRPHGVDEGYVGMPAADSTFALDPEDAVYDVVLDASGAWEQVLVDPPPPEILVEDEDTGLVAAYLVDLVYDDLDASGDYSDPYELDSLLATVCWEGRQTVVGWVSTPTTFLGMASIEAAAWHAGWFLVALGDGSEDDQLLDTDQARELAIDRTGCNLVK